MKQVLIAMLKTLIQILESDECKLSDRQAYCFIEMAKRVAEERESFTKTEVAERLHCSTKTVERHIRDGFLKPGKKRRGHTSLYWTGYEISECKERLADRDWDKKQ